ncbi:uncharacterized protein FYW47_003052 [Aplochiton taeniatus]
MVCSISPTEMKIKALKQEEEPSEENSQTQSGVLTWLSNGFSSALPQPAGSPRLSRTNSDARANGEADRNVMIGWIAQGLTKMVPQPDEKYREDPCKDTEENTEVYDVKDIPDVEPLPHIPVVEMFSEDEQSEVESIPQFPPKISVNWLLQSLPQPVMPLPPGAVPIETQSKRSSLDKVLSPTPESLSGISLTDDSKGSNVVGWFVQGLGLKMPQPVPKMKDDVMGAAEVLQIESASRRVPDMVLEEVVESDWNRKNQDVQSTTSTTLALSAEPQTMEPPPQQIAQQTDLENSAQEVVTQNQTPAVTQTPSQSLQEDAETQTGRWTPFIENIKTEAERVVIAAMEER